MGRTAARKSGAILTALSAMAGAIHALSTVTVAAVLGLEVLNKVVRDEQGVNDNRQLLLGEGEEDAL
jgi:hypothetical protein